VDHEAHEEHEGSADLAAARSAGVSEHSRPVGFPFVPFVRFVVQRSWG